MRMKEKDFTEFTAGGSKDADIATPTNEPRRE